MRSDIAEFLKSGKPKLFSVFGRGAKKEEWPAWPELAGHRWFLTTLAAIAVLTALAGAAFFVFNRRLADKPGGGQSEFGASLRPAQFLFENTSVIAVSRKSELLKTLEEINRRPEPQNSMRRLVLGLKKSDGTEKIMDASEFFGLLNLAPPQELSANLVGPVELFFSRSGDRGSFGLVVKTSNPQRTRQGLIKWESDLPRDMEILLAGRTAATIDATFKDYTYRNIDFRFLDFEGQDGQGIGYLVFPAKGLVVIAASFEAMRQTVERLLEAR